MPCKLITARGGRAACGGVNLVSAWLRGRPRRGTDHSVGESLGRAANVARLAVTKVECGADEVCDGCCARAFVVWGPDNMQVVIKVGG